MKINLSKTKQNDFRVSTLPTLFGEKVVLRILDAGAAKLRIEKLGYEPDQPKLILEAIQKPYGMVLVTGPDWTSTRLNPVTNATFVCRLMLDKTIPIKDSV